MRNSFAIFFHNNKNQVKRKNGSFLIHSKKPTRLPPFLGIQGGSSSPQQQLEFSSSTTSLSSSNTVKPEKNLKLVQVQVVHRHGDRTPITPMRNETFWKSALPTSDILKNIALGTQIIRDLDKPKASHSASGKGAFGQLTTLGLFQMVELGSKLRDEINMETIGKKDDNIEDKNEDDEDDEMIINQNNVIYKMKDKYLFSSTSTPLSPQSITVMSTDFPRTIQSVQALLIGLFPDGMSTNLDIDARHTNIMIPDPQPRRTIEQTELEKQLIKRPYLIEKDKEMKDLAIHVTTELQKHVLGEGFNEISFGVGEEKEDNGNNKDHVANTTIAPLPWAQLSEILKCLAVRDMLPPSIHLEQQKRVTSHAAWRWFENLRHPRLAWLAMDEMMKQMIQNTQNMMKEEKGINRSASSTTTPLHIFSGHDSTLIGLLCAFRLEQPAEWPPYGSIFKMELWKVIETNDNETKGDIKMDDPREKNINQTKPQYFVRFSLNSRTLKCHWGSVDGVPLDLVPVDQLVALLHENSTD